MNKNEYRRAFIMLRAVEPGYGGHVRLEARVLSGSLYFIVTAPEGSGELTALLAGQRNGVYAAASLGTLRRDRRGQLTLARQIDPRDIEGRPLGAYQWVVIAAGERGKIVLTGNINGSRPMDPAALARAVRARLDVRESAPRLRESVPAADLPEPGEVLPSPQPAAPAQAAPTTALGESHRAVSPSAVPAGMEAPVVPDPEAAAAPVLPEDAGNRRQAPGATAAGKLSKPTPEADATGAAVPEETSDVKIYTISRSRLFAARDAQDRRTSEVDRASDAAAEPAPTASGDRPVGSPSAMDAGPAPAAPSPELPADAGAAGASPASLAEAIQSISSNAADTSDGASSASLADTVPAEPSPATLREPGAARADEAPAAPPLRTAAKVLGLDITRPWPGCLEPLRRLFATQAPLEDAPDGEHVYVRAPMPDKSGFDACLVGLRASNGAPVNLRYALPARRSPEPPPGLDGYRWLGDGESGWWVTDAESF
ncbi:MAG: hypothetical protein Q4C10_11250 [Clostridia bacterium]|nr:hypothetical protein [Clostridia bacterium]